MSLSHVLSGNPSKKDWGGLGVLLEDAVPPC